MISLCATSIEGYTTCHLSENVKFCDTSGNNYFEDIFLTQVTDQDRISPYTINTIYQQKSDENKEKYWFRDYSS